MKDKAILVDSSSLIYAALHTIDPRLSFKDQKVFIIFGFFNKILSIAKQFETSNFYFCFDHQVNFRKQINKEYKAKRNQKKKELSPLEAIAYQEKIKQEKELREVSLKQFGFKNIFHIEGYESDDILAALCDIVKTNKLYMVTNDSDMYQCLDKCTIINPSGLKLFSKKHFIEKYKVKPSQWAICKSIGGCYGDEVIGIKGASDPKNEKSLTLKYIRNELTKGKIYDRIVSEDGQEVIKKNSQLVTLPFDQKIYDKILLRRNNFSKKNIISTFSKYNFKSHLEHKFNDWTRLFL